MKDYFTETTSHDASYSRDEKPLQGYNRSKEGIESPKRNSLQCQKRSLKVGPSGEQNTKTKIQFFWIFVFVFRTVSIVVYDVNEISCSVSFLNFSIVVEGILQDSNLQSHLHFKILTSSLTEKNGQKQG